MPQFGAHVSVAGGLHKAAETARQLGMETLQIFTKNANQWVGKPLTEDEIRAFKAAVKAASLKHPTAHDSYLINLASPNEELYQRSIGAFADELERAESLGLSYLVTHPGAHTGSGVEAGVERVAAAIDVVHERCAGFKVRVLLETTAGSGTTLGAKFEELAAIRNRVQDASRIGVCLDTCHVFAAGYPLGTDAEYRATFEQFDNVIGLSNLKLFHVNDSARELGSRVDRHAGLGLGHIGLEPFRRLVTDSRFKRLPMILETPKEDDDGREMDPVNLAILRGFLPKTRSKAG